VRAAGLARGARGRASALLAIRFHRRHGGQGDERRTDESVFPSDAPISCSENELVPARCTDHDHVDCRGTSRPSITNIGTRAHGRTRRQKRRSRRTMFVTSIVPSWSALTAAWRSLQRLRRTWLFRIARRTLKSQSTPLRPGARVSVRERLSRKSALRARPRITF